MTYPDGGDKRASQPAQAAAASLPASLPRPGGDGGSSQAAHAPACPLLREYDRRAIRSSHDKIHVFEMRKVIKKTKCHVKQSVNISNIVLAKSTIEVL